jgi:putative thiamine transport system ATP-binding protein
MSGVLMLDALRVTLRGQTLVDLTTAVTPGDILTIMGPSGTGKSTLLAAIIGTLPAEFKQSGTITLAGRDIGTLPTRLRRVGILFQDDILFPHLSVGQNLAFALPPTSGPPSARRDRIEAALASADLSGFAERDPATLSGGQRARVALLRTLLADPCALLLDEPFSSLDSDLRAQIRSFVFDSARAAGVPVILVTHDAEDARAAGGRVLSPLGKPAPI